MRSRRRGFLVAAVVLALGLMVGAAAAITTPIATGRADRPLTAYWGFAQTEEDRAIEESIFEQEETQRQALIVSCMSRQGFEYKPAISSVLVTDEMTAAQARSLLADPNDGYRKSLTSEQQGAYNLALTGYQDPNHPQAGAAQGCVGEAHEAIPGVFHVRGILNKEMLAMEREFLDDPEIRALQGAWSSCMGSRGWEFATPIDVSASVDLDVLSEAEFQMALADSDTCARDVGLTNTARRIREAKERAFIADHADILVVASR